MEAAQNGTKDPVRVEPAAVAEPAVRGAPGETAGGGEPAAGGQEPAAVSAAQGVPPAGGPGERLGSGAAAEPAEAPGGSSRASPVAPLHAPGTPASSGDDSKAQQVPFKVLLTQEQALEIYRIRPLDSDANAKPTSIEVAEKYGVSPKTIRDVWNRKTWVKVTRPLWEPTELETYLSESVRRKPFGRPHDGFPHGEGAEEGEDDGPARARRPVREARNNKRELLSPGEELGSLPRRSGGKRGGGKRQKGAQGGSKAVSRPPPPSKAPPPSQRAIQQMMMLNGGHSQLLGAGCRPHLPGEAPAPIDLMYGVSRGPPDAPDNRFEPDGGMSYNAQTGSDQWAPWQDNEVMLDQEEKDHHLDLGTSPSSPRNVDYPSTSEPMSRTCSLQNENNILSVVDW